MGRPTEYTDDIVLKTNEYIDSCTDEHYDWVKSESTGKVDSTSWEHRVKVKLPTIEGLSLFLKVNRDTIYDWEKKYENFSDTLKELRSKQAKMLIENGLSGDYNPTIAKLILSSNHGMREKSDVTTNDKDLPTPILNVLPNLSDKQNSGDEETNKGSTGWDLSE
ncbi:MAG: terminase small subunit [Paracoccaceae bacterium]